MRLRAERANHDWRYHFVTAWRHDGRVPRLLTLIDEYTQECLAILVARRIGLIELLDEMMLVSGVPATKDGPVVKYLIKASLPRSLIQS